jgi:hypothetical protein
MRTSIVLTLLAVAAGRCPAAQPIPVGPELTASLGGSDGTEMTSGSSRSRHKDRPGETIVTNVIRNHFADPLIFGQNGDTGTVRAAATANGKVTPRAVTRQWSTYRPLESGVTQLDHALPGPDGPGSCTACQWQEMGDGYRAKPGNRLTARLIDGEANGTELVRCTAEVAEPAPAQYRYTVTVENCSRQAIEFEWAGHRGKLESGKSYSQAVEAKVLTEERPDKARVSFADGNTFVFKANTWAKP